MARRTPPHKTKNSTPREPARVSLSEELIAPKLERARRRREAEREHRAEERAATRAHAKSRIERPAPKKLRDDFKQHGFVVTDKGVKVDGPRDKHRQPIKGARTTLLKGGVVKQSIGQRRDFIYGFTKKEKREFAKDPKGFTDRKMRELEKLFPSLREHRRKRQTRLQWGAYQAQKDFTPTYFNVRYFAAPTLDDVRREGKRRAKPRIDKLTGLHIVIHIPKRSTARKSNAGERGKQKGRRRR